MTAPTFISHAGTAPVKVNSPEILRILIVEDEFLVALVLEDDLRSAGHTVLGPFSNLPSALEGARRETFDVAVLDINLGGTMVYPLADDLTRRGVPFLFLTGYGPADIPVRFAQTPRVAKPYESSSLLTAIRRVAARA
jgi:DNA-binding response OmpR family regulator